MATSAQIIANQKNAKLSTGPKTPEGKSAAARNSVKHGLSGAFRVLADENQEEFDSLVAKLTAEFVPANEHELFLVEQMAQSRWRLRRIQRFETAVLDQMLENGIQSPDPDRRIAAKLLLGGGDALSSLHRYATAAERSYYKAHKELTASKALVQNEANSASALQPARAAKRASSPDHGTSENTNSAAVQDEPNFRVNFVPRENQSAAGEGFPLDGRIR